LKPTSLLFVLIDKLFRPLIMEKFALLARVEAKPGKENEVLAFLKSALPLAEAEPDTVRWYALQLGPSTFGIFDTFETEAGRQAHLEGRIAEALMANAANLLAKDPIIEKVDLLAIK
jgi:quinol monooxygenase YgiN